MKFAVVKEHRDFFRKNQRIEFDGLLSPSQCEKFVEAQRSVLSDRLNVTNSETAALSMEKVYMTGRDVWRGSSVLKKLILQDALAAAAAELIELKPLRIAYDQLIPPRSTFSGPAKDLCLDWFATPKTLKEISCIQGVLCGLMLCVAEPPPTDVEMQISEINTSIFPAKAGNGIFFSPDAAVDFMAPARLQGHTYVMVVYAQKSSVYYRQEGDLNLHALKKLGYNFGDRLLDRYHPLVYT